MAKIYLTNEKNTHRFAYGSEGSKPLIVLGLNPSGLPDHDMNATLRNVEAFSKILNFDSYVMLNLYSQRATDPSKLHKRLNNKEQRENIKIISQSIDENSTIWAAWGNLIDTRPYFINCLSDILGAIEGKNMNWLKYDKLTKVGHPKHPLYKKHENRFEAFDVESYLRAQKKQG